VAVTDDGAVIMVRQFRLAAGRALLEVPAGTLDEGEEPIDCAARELEEETGFRATRIRPMFSAYLAPGYSSELIHAFLATGLTRPDTPASIASMDSDENLEVDYILLADLEAMILRGELQDSKSISSILTAAKLLEDS
jgi:8-oxo-dGTP pyrophosphatase MutT (NUDIX family)